MFNHSFKRAGSARFAYRGNNAIVSAVAIATLGMASAATAQLPKGLAATSSIETAGIGRVGASMVNVLPRQSLAFNAPTYTSSDGALTVHAGGTYVEPYFANKSLLAARSAGLDIRQTGTRWVDWLRARQTPTGSFSRYAQIAPGSWVATGPADADDALFATWIELLHALSPNTGLPAKWQNSYKLAKAQLDALRDPNTGIYSISSSLRVGLLMDNCEIYGSLMNVARDQERMGQIAKAKQTRLEAANLASAINRVFWRKDWNEYAISTQEVPRDTFYPYAVAQIYPLMDGLATPLQTTETPRVTYSRWLDGQYVRWINMQSDPYPWGMIALTGLILGDKDTATNWMTSAAPLRYSGRWNVLEEAIYQGLDAQL